VIADAVAEQHWSTDSRAVRRISFFADAPAVRASWPMTVPAVAQLQDAGLELAPGVTFLVGENGSGKSTVLEGIAMAFGFPPEGGSRNGGASTRPSESPLGEWGIRETSWDELELVAHWRRFLDAPGRYLRHLDG
jgi:hypothetical protein